MTLATRRSFVAALFVAPALIAAPRLMRVSAKAFDFWVEYQSWPLEDVRPEVWHWGRAPYWRFQEVKPHLLDAYGASEWHPYSAIEWRPVPEPRVRVPVASWANAAPPFRLEHGMSGCLDNIDHWTREHAHETA